MEAETLKVRSSIKPILLQNAVMRGTILGILGLCLLLVGGILLPPSLLRYWGLPLLLLGGGLIAWGLIPYRRLRRLELRPNELVAVEDRLLTYFSNGKPVLSIPLVSIREISHLDSESDYGIKVMLESPLPEKVVIHDPEFDIDLFQQKSLVDYNCDLFFPYFSKNALEALQRFQREEELKIER